VAAGGGGPGRVLSSTRQKRGEGCWFQNVLLQVVFLAHTAMTERLLLLLSMGIGFEWLFVVTDQAIMP